ncbi:VOC family protein [Azospirillum sp.]|uniref:VOC family protein n=1 Tax=Azospirillum sp. TaxID=34012 RepID=UPI002D5CCA36|nr:VOC family protein [Azospirillum sp.]HYD68675.1 VOC family protein [Azospirillum sp.]
MPKITPFLWFDTQAEEAARFYVSIFPNSRIGDILRYGDAGPGPEGSVMTIAFELDGRPFAALNGGPHFTFNEAISFAVDVADQAELDALWDTLCDGGTPGQCGWLKDRYGVSWQVVPGVVMEMLADPDPARVRRVMVAIHGMTRIDIAGLRRAYEG